MATTDTDTKRSTGWICAYCQEPVGDESCQCKGNREASELHEAAKQKAAKRSGLAPRERGLDILVRLTVLHDKISRDFETIRGYIHSQHGKPGVGFETATEVSLNTAKYEILNLIEADIRELAGIVRAIR